MNNTVNYNPKKTNAYTHHCGDLFEDRRDGEIYILINYFFEAKRLYGLFCLEDGTVYDDGLELVNGLLPSEAVEDLNHLGKRHIEIS
jgi:hypothetical protein